MGFACNFVSKCMIISGFCAKTAKCRPVYLRVFVCKLMLALHSWHKY